MVFTKVYSVTFNVFLKDPKKWGDRYGRSHTAIICAKDLNEVISKWPEVLLQYFPYEPGTGGSHYSEDPVYGSRLEFTDIHLVQSAAAISPFQYTEV